VMQSLICIQSFPLSDPIFYLPLLNSLAKKYMYLGRKKLWEAFAPPPPTSYAYAYADLCTQRRRVMQRLIKKVGCKNLGSDLGVALN
jgi:hypothetical protein